MKNSGVNISAIFRGKCVDDGKWVRGYYVFRRKRHGCFGQTITELDRDAHYIITIRGDSYEVIPSTVSQYTGLKDSNDRLIFADDIFILNDIGWQQRYLVFFQEGAFCARIYNSPALSHLDNNGDEYFLGAFTEDNNRVEIIGNIHDNPELLDIKY